MLVSDGDVDGMCWCSVVGLRILYDSVVFCWCSDLSRLVVLLSFVWCLNSLMLFGCLNV